MIGLLLNIRPGDEVILPSFTFVSTASAFVLRGAKLVFVDIKADDLNINEDLIESAITRKTKCIVVVHYAGIACNLKKINEIAKNHDLYLIEDAAHCFNAKYYGKELGTFGDFGAFSFHETKNIISGEGGALLVNNPKFIKRAEIVWQKGTDRSRFMRGEVDKYTWQDIGSSFLPGELISACLWGQLENSGVITKKRKILWNNYQKAFKNLEKRNLVKRPVVKPFCDPNGHIYYLILNSELERDMLIKFCHKNKITVCFHYLPLHKSPFIKKKLNVKVALPNTERICKTIVRLPLFYKMTKNDQQRVIKTIYSFFGH
jgi:dTDP-4-amino-4,6-dideoxygalactose transaminase